MPKASSGEPERYPPSAERHTVDIEPSHALTIGVPVRVAVAAQVCSLYLKAGELTRR